MVHGREPRWSGAGGRFYVFKALIKIEIKNIRFWCSSMMYDAHLTRTLRRPVKPRAANQIAWAPSVKVFQTGFLRFAWAFTADEHWCTLMPHRFTATRWPFKVFSQTILYGEVLSIKSNLMEFFPFFALPNRSLNKCWSMWMRFCFFFVLFDVENSSEYQAELIHMKPDPRVGVVR